jgi:hypothetical protein
MYTIDDYRWTWNHWIGKWKPMIAPCGKKILRDGMILHAGCFASEAAGNCWSVRLQAFLHKPQALLRSELGIVGKMLCLWTWIGSYCCLVVSRCLKWIQVAFHFWIMYLRLPQILLVMHFLQLFRGVSMSSLHFMVTGEIKHMWHQDFICFFFN